MTGPYAGSVPRQGASLDTSLRPAERTGWDGVRKEGESMPWTDVVTALSTAVIAILLALPAVASFLLFRELRRAVTAIERFGDTLQKEIVPAVQAARGAVDQTGQMAGTIRGEVEAVIET